MQGSGAESEVAIQCKNMKIRKEVHSCMFNSNIYTMFTRHWINSKLVKFVRYYYV